MHWVERAEGLLYEGESVQETVPVGAGGIVVTTHRLLAFTPDREGPNFRQVDRPNVDGVEVRTVGTFQFLQRAVKALVGGGVLLAAGLAVNLEGMVAGISPDGGTAGTVGIGGMIGTLRTVLSLLARLDDLLRVFGALALALGAILLAVYLWSRERLLVVAVAGGEDIELTASDEAVVDRLQAALFQETAATPPENPMA